MTELVRKCSCSWENGKCRFSAALEGWGCRLLTCMPESIPQTEREKAELFANVYRYAEEVGILECPHYDESVIDHTIDDTAQLAQMIHLGCPVRAELLSDFILQK